ncbi:MAG TPA: M28 family peptidase [Gemmatimonadaceae bacterium]|nr:M28 family peptidase [Gemmatimonadaceae bacterium]
MPNSLSRQRRAVLGALALSAIAVNVSSAQARANKYGYPEKRAPRPTSAAITDEDLMTRLYIFADDSMQGRQFGRLGNMKGTNYIAREVRRLGLLPAGDSGTYFQRLPLVQRRFLDRSTMTVDGAVLRFNTDFVPTPTAQAPRPIQNAPVVFGGSLADPSSLIPADQANGKVVVLLPAPMTTAGGRGGNPPTAGANMCAAILNPALAGQAGGRAGFGGQGGFNPLVTYANAAAIVVVSLDLTPAGRRAFINDPIAVAAPQSPPTPRAPIVVTRNGVIGTVQNGVLAGGALPAGMTPAQLQQMIDSIRVDSLSRVRRMAVSAASERVRACATADSIAVSHGAPSMLGPGGIAAADSAAMASLLPGGRGFGGGAGGGRGGAGGGRGGIAPDGAGPAAMILVTRAAAERLLGRSTVGMTPGTAGRTVTAALAWEERDASDYGRNVVAMIPGSDPGLKGQYVLLSAHNDHVGFNTSPVDHDSLKAFNDALMRLRMSRRVGDLVEPTAQERASIVVNMDSLRAIRPARLDSISNGADDDGSGSMAILEIAEYIARMPVKPKRSTIFVWQTGEEGGLRGSAYYATHPTVPIDSIVANINIDMIGRGRAEDIPGGGPTYVGVVGSGFMSADLAQVVASTNLKQKQPLALDPKFDLPTTWPGYNNIYGRSDHYNYARQCIPIAFFFTGLHGDYHQRTDEAQYIDYPHFSLITNYIRDVVVELGQRPQRPSLDKPCLR